MLKIKKKKNQKTCVAFTSLEKPIHWLRGASLSKEVWPKRPNYEFLNQKQPFADVLQNRFPEGLQLY